MRIELTYKGFADLSLTTWVPRHGSALSGIRCLKRSFSVDQICQETRELGQTVMMITHNPEAAKYGDRIIHMRDGEIVQPERDPQWTGD